jgi:threonine-phosphate decarboxylase
LYSEKNLIHGGDIYTDRGLNTGTPLLDFSANLNPLGMPESVRQAAIQAISESEAYPDPLCRKLRDAIARKEGVPAERIVCGNGAADLLYRLVWEYKPKCGLVPAPTFAEYELALRNAGAAVEIAPFFEENGFVPNQEFIQKIEDHVDIVFFCNPNNPTGLTVDQEYLRSLAEQCRQIGALLVVDECFLCFVRGGEEKSAVPLLEEFENLLVLKAFTKLYAMAGLRLGYLLCSTGMQAERIAASGQAWSVSTPAQAAGIAACGEAEFAERSQNYVAENREILAEVLRECGAKVYPSEANYLFFRYQDVELPQKMLSSGILIRSCGNYHTLNAHYFRIAVRTSEENQKFAAALRMVSAQKG